MVKQKMDENMTTVRRCLYYYHYSKISSKLNYLCGRKSCSLSHSVLLKNLGITIYWNHYLISIVIFAKLYDAKTVINSHVTQYENRLISFLTSHRWRHPTVSCGSYLHFLSETHPWASRTVMCLFIQSLPANYCQSHQVTWKLDKLSWWWEDSSHHQLNLSNFLSKVLTSPSKILFLSRASFFDCCCILTATVR